MNNIDFDNIDLTQPIPLDEPQRQIYFLAQCKQLLKIKSTKLGRPLKMFTQTFGCQMNEHDSEKLSGMLLDMGYIEAVSKENADFIIFNTCAIRENAELKVYGHLGSLKKLKAENENLIIAICGCMMQQKEVVEHIQKKYKHVDIIFGTHNLYKLPEFVFTAINNNTSFTEILKTTGNVVEKISIKRNNNIKASVNIIYGCNNFCSYCIVPYVRGRERSRKPEDIVREVISLAQDGYKEITLLGQNVNSYGNDLKDENITFTKLLYSLSKIEGIERIRFMTPHPKDFSDELIFAIRDLDKICKHIHLPLQSGSSKILVDMNRKYSKEQYLELVKKIKDNIPNVTITTDIIVGFPGETEENFKDTLDVVSKAKFDMAFTFIYSKRTGTPAAKSPNQIPEEIVKERFDRLLELQNKISKENNTKLLGQELEILVEGFSKNSTNKLTGRNSGNKVVNFHGPSHFIGNIVKVKIIDAQTWSLEGKII